MDTARARHLWNGVSLDAPVQAAILACVVAVVCYQSDRLVYVLGIPPDHIASFWPPTAFLVAVLLLVRRSIQPVLIVAGLGAMALADLRNGVPIGFEIWVSLGNLGELLVAVWGIGRLFKGVPDLSSITAFLKYFVFAVILVPFASALVGANASAPGGYWLQWRLWFFADALAFLTVAPAILNWVREGRVWARESRNKIEFAALMASLFFSGYLAFMGSGQGEPALLYSLVPLLLWAALRVGLKGVSTSMLVVALLSIWGASRGRGPFAAQGPLNNALSLQLFLFFAAIPFMFLAALVEEQKRAKQALTDEGAQLLEAQRVAQVGSWQWDPNTDTVTWSEELYRMAGRDPNSPAPTYKEHPQVYTDESWKRLQQAVEEALRTGKAYELDLEMVRPDGTTRWLIARGLVQRDAAGRIVSLRGTVKDITERKRAEDALLASREMFQAIWDNCPATIFVKDLQGRFVDHNLLFSKEMALPREQIIGKTDEELFPAEMAATCQAEDRQVIEQNRALEVEASIELEDGKHTSILQKFPLRDAQGKPYAICGIVTDITERKRAEAALRESEERFRMAVQAGKMFAYEWDAATDRIVRSEGVTQVLGESHGLLTTGQEILANVVPEDRGRLLAAIAGLSPEEPYLRISYRRVRSDGTVMWVERNSRADFDEQGRMLRLRGMVADITERKQAEEALAGMSRRLIEAQEQERTRIARELHDDFGQRLALLSVELQGMRDFLPDSAAALRSRTSELETRISEISSDLQALSHELHSSKLEYVGLVAAMQSLCAELAKKQKVDIDFTHEGIPAGLPREISLCLFRVMQEALHNAAKHSGTRHFKVTVQGSANEIQLSVRDSGMGFDPELARNNQGLGLTSMRERVNIVKGKFSITSSPHSGTEVSVCVPIAAGTQTEQSRVKALGMS